MSHQQRENTASYVNKFFLDTHIQGDNYVYIRVYIFVIQVKYMGLFNISMEFSSLIMLTRSLKAWISVMKRGMSS